VSPAKVDKLVRMANQIGAAFGALPESEAAASAAGHVRLYWTPKMIREIVAFADLGKPGLDMVAANAIKILKNESAG
jgi:formate dehydrogenase subunit delta